MDVFQNMLWKPGINDAFVEKCYMLVDEAEKWVGVREHGRNSGPEVEMFQKAVDQKASGESWCLAFVQYCVKQVDKDYLLKSKKDPYSQVLHPTEHCLNCWNNTPRDSRVYGLKNLHPGLVVIWQYWKNGKQTINGHTGIIKEVNTDGSLTTIEGNTRNHEGVVREGDGVYEVKRQITTDGNFRVKGFLKPWPGEFNLFKGL